MTKSYKILLSAFSGLLLALAWPGIGGFSPLLFIAFVPILFVENSIFRSEKGSTYGITFLSFMLFNGLSAYWLYMVSEGIETKLLVYLFAVLLNSSLMALVFHFFHYTRKKIGSKEGYIGLVLYWVAFEYLHFHWELTWPWMTLGNGFANTVHWVQWYEYTGVFGGSIWILIVNITIYKILDKAINDQISIKENRLKISSFLLILLVPIFCSMYIYSNYEEKKDPVTITIIQPNVDPYFEKYRLGFEEQLDSMLFLVSADQLSASDYLIAPETALTEDIWENDLERSITIPRIKKIIADHPQLNFVSGLTSYYLFEESEERSATARQFSNNTRWYDAYNAAIQINNTENIEFYHKSKLVQGVEKMPFASFLKPLESLALDLGGTIGSLGSQEEAEVFTSHNGKIKIAPVICYESIYGEYVGEYVKAGANLIFIITNDGWWGDGPGYAQHLAYARLRAIETRRSIARSANTGISCFIDQRGEYIQSAGWWTAETLHTELNSNDTLTFYTKHGDYLGRIASFTAIILLLYSMAIPIYARKKPA